MLETPHVAVGAAIATKIPNPLIAIPLAFASHFALEIVPHWNPHIRTETLKFGRPTRKSTNIIVLDSILALSLGTVIAYQALPNTGHAVVVLAASFASVLPDLIEAPYFFFKSRHKFFDNWISFQKSIQNDTTPLWGLLSQFATIAAAVLWIRG